MAQPYYARETKLHFGDRKGETVYSAQPYYNGTLTTKQVAAQVAQESALTQAEVLGVLDRLSYYFQSHLSLGYKIKIDGLGTFYNALITRGTAAKAEEVNRKLIRGVRPAFSPEYTMLNNVYRYTLLPERTELTKVDFRTGKAVEEEDDNSNPGGDSGNPGGGTNPGGGGGDDGSDLEGI